MPKCREAICRKARQTAHTVAKQPTNPSAVKQTNQIWYYILQ
jgi:hypothetical protein